MASTLNINDLTNLTVSNVNSTAPTIASITNAPVDPAKPTSVDISLLQTQKNSLIVEEVDSIIDRNWAKQAFLLNDFKLYPNAEPNQIDGNSNIIPNPEWESNIDYYNRFYTTANSKFTDTKLGCSLGINARPQFNRYSDIRVPGRLAGRVPDVQVAMSSSASNSANYGMGRYYSEAIDDNAQKIYMRFGVPSFNSLTNYISAAYDPDLASLARTGRGTSVFYTAGEVIGTLTTLTAFPVLAIGFVTTKVLGNFFRTTNSKFYTLKPAMHLYWGAVNSLVNSIAIDSGLFPPFLENDSAIQAIGQTWNLDNEQLKVLHAMMPDVFTDGNGYDIFAMGTKAQRYANQLAKDEYKMYSSNSELDFYGFVKKQFTETVTDPVGTHNGMNGAVNAFNTLSVSGLSTWVQKYLNFDLYKSKDGQNNAIEQTSIFTSSPKLDANGQQVVDSVTGNTVMQEQLDVGTGGWFKELTDSMDAEMHQGSEFAIFVVDNTGPSSESFGNSAVESELSQKLNNMSSGNREARFSVADGNISDGIIGTLVQDSLSAVKDFATGAINGVTLGTFGGIAALAGNGFFDIPKHWQSSTATLPRANYTIQLISPYGNLISRMQNLYIPLSMLLAGSVPLSTGKYTYTSPFLCQLFDRGRCQIQLGMIESLQITRGTSTLGFTNRGKVLAIDVSFSVVDLSSILHMPLSTGSIFGYNTNTDPDNVLMDYIATLAGQDIYSQLYAIPKARINLAKKYAQIRNFISPANAASYINDSMISGWMSYLFPISTAYNAVSMLNTGSSLVANDRSML